MSTSPLAPAPKPAWQLPVGLALVLPAFVLLIVSYVWPTIWTVRSSFQRVTVLRGGAEGGSGPRNYEAVFDEGLTSWFGFAVSLAVVPMLVVLVVAPLLAWAAHLGGTITRWVTRGVLVLPLAAYAPVAVAYAQFAGTTEERRTVESAALTRTFYWLGAFGIVAALAVTVFLAALRRRDPARSPWPGLVVAAGLGAAAVLAAALQEFVVPIAGTVSSRSTTPVVGMYVQGLVRFDFGRGAAVSTLLLAALMLLGLGVTVLAVLTGLRLELDGSYSCVDRPPGWPTSRVVGVALTAVGLIVVLVITLIGIGPLLGHVFGGGGAPDADLPASRATLAVNTWVPPLLSSLVGVGVAALAAFGIGALRPFGRRSEWLLLPFGLFLFVGVGPLALRAYAAGATSGRLNSFLGLVPPTWVALPALFLLTLLFRGQALRAESLRQQGQPVPLARQALPALPMVALAFLVTWVVQAQDLLWQVISAPGGDRTTAPVAFAQIMQVFNGPPDQAPYHLVLPLGVFVAAFLLGVGAQLLYLDRVALRVGLPEHDAPLRT